MKISFVIPVYNERDTLRPLAEGILEHVKPHEAHILLIDDGSTDGSLPVMQELAAEHPEVEVIKLRGNFGKSAALAVGFAHADGDLVFTMDSDLQDDPKEIPAFLAKAAEGHDVVCGWKERRYDPWHKVIPSRFYNRFVAWLFDVPLHDVNCGFKLFKAEVVKKFQIYGEMHRLIPVLAHNLNYSVAEIPVQHHKRQYGVSKYGFERFVRGALDVLTTWFLHRYRHAPGHFFGGTGLVQMGLGGLAIVAGLFAALVWGAAGITIGCFVVGLVLGATGFITLSLGLFAELVLRHFVRIDPALYAVDE